MKLFNWADYEFDIHIGFYRRNRKPPKKKEGKKSPPRKRDWKAEYQKRLIAGTANKVKSKNS